MVAWLREMKAITGDCEEKTKALPETTEACPMKTRACLEEEKEPAPKETEAVEEPRDVHIGETDEEASGGTEDRTGEQRPAVRRHRQRKERVQVNGGPR
jgi:chromatin segregation and condensation protein Rec8/ScpA/Scc1 (kleisin family)